MHHDVELAIDPAAIVDAVSGPARFGRALHHSLQASDQRFGNVLVVVRAVDLGSADGLLRPEHRRAGALLARSVDAERPVGQLADDVFAVALFGSDAPSGESTARRIELAVSELRKLDPAFADLTVAIAVLEITSYDVLDPVTLFERAVAAVDQEQSWEERARAATLHLVGAAAMVDLRPGTMDDASPGSSQCPPGLPAW